MLKKFCRRFLRVLAALLGGVAVLVVLALLLLPYFASFLPLPDVAVDLSDHLKGDAANLVSNRTLTARLNLSRSSRGGLLLKANGRLLDWPYALSADVDWSIFRLRADARFDFAFDRSAWRVCGSAVATPRTWKAAVQVPQATLDQDDPVISSLLARLPTLSHKNDVSGRQAKASEPSFSDLTFAASIDFRASAEKTRELPVPVWSAKGKVANAVASATVGSSALSVDGLQLAFGADGIANRITFAPFLPRVKRLAFGDLTIDNVYAALRMTEKFLLVTEAGADFCGGNVRLYSLFLDPQNLTSGFTVFLDNVDAGQAMSLIKDFRGEATGRLHGKLPLFLKDGRELRLKDAYLYSTPGETGSIRMSDPEPLLDNLALGGVDDETRANFAKALSNLLYTVLKIDLRRDTDGGLALGLKIEGSSTHRGKTVPVNFEVTFRGDLEQLLNTGLKASLGK